MAVKIIKTQTHSTQINHYDLANVGVNTHQQLDEIADEVRAARDGNETLDQRIDNDVTSLQNDVNTISNDIDSLQTQVGDVVLEIEEARGGTLTLDQRFDDIELELTRKYEKPEGGIPVTDLDPAVMESISHWKSPVATVDDLPIIDNSDGDARVVLQDGSIYIWVNNAWKQISGGGSEGGGGGATGNNLYVGKNVVIEYQYDADNRLIREITTGDINRTKDYIYNDNNDIIQIVMTENGQSYIQTFEYVNGNISRITNNGVDLFFRAAASGYVGGTAETSAPIELEQEIIEARDGNPTLDARLDTIESQLVLNSKAYEEDFGNSPLVDYSQTTAIVGDGYVKLGKQATFTEEFNDTDNIDSDISTNIAISDGMLKLANGALWGTMQSKVINTTNTNHAIINYNVNHYSDYAFSQYDLLVDLGTTNSYILNIYYDKINDRLWVFFVGASSYLYYKIFNADGTVFTDTTLIWSTAIAGNGRIGVSLDYNNKLWIAWATYVSYCYVCAFDLNGNKVINNIQIATNYRSDNRIDLFVTSDNKILIASVDSSYYITYFAVLNSDGTFFKNSTQANGYNYPGLRIIHDPINNNYKILSASGGYTRGIVLDSSFTTWTAVNLSTADTKYAIYFYKNGYIYCFSKLNSNGHLAVKQFDLTPALVSTIDTGITGVVDGLLNYLEDNGIYHVVYVKTTTNNEIHYTTFDSNFNIIRSDIVASYPSDISITPYIYKTNSGEIRIVYSALLNGTGAYKVKQSRFVPTNTQANFYISNDNGTTYIPCTSGQQIDFANPGNQLRVKIELTSPYSVLTPEVLRYDIQEWADNPSPQLSGIFVTPFLPFTEPLSKAILTATQVLNGGTINWYITNNGGINWYPINLGEEITFTERLNDVRLKAELISPAGSFVSPIINYYRLVGTSTLVFADFNNLQVNLMKTNFKIDSLSNAARNSMKNMLIDVFSNADGIDGSQSDFTFDAIRKSIKGTTVITTPEIIDYYPSKVLLCADYIGAIDFYVSRDGINWTQVYPDIICDINNQPYNNLLRVKFVMQANAELFAYALAWS